jgi:hypothetical protein
VPFARSGPPTLENLCLLCSAHNLESARQVFGEKHIDAKIRAGKSAAHSVEQDPLHPVEQVVPENAPLDAPTKVLSSLRNSSCASAAQSEAQ